MTFDRISFCRSDYSHTHLENVAEKIASFFEQHPRLMNDFSELMRISSKCTLYTYRNQLEQWIKYKLGLRNAKKKHIAPDTEQLIAMANHFFSVCKSDEEIKKMRGLVPEKIIEKN